MFFFFFLILGHFPSSLGKKLRGFIPSIRVKKTLQELIQSPFVLTENTFKEHPLIFRPTSTVSVGSQAGCDFIKGNASLLLVAFLRSSFLQTGEGASSLPSLPTGDQGVPYSNRQSVDYRHNEKKELISLSTKYNPDLGRQFQISIRQTLCELYWVQDMLSSEKTGMNTSEIFTLLIKYSLPKAYGRWQKKNKNLKTKPDILSE